MQLTQASSVIRNLNPELKRDITPRGDVYNVQYRQDDANQFAESSETSFTGQTRNSAGDFNCAGRRSSERREPNRSQCCSAQAMNGGVDLKSATKLVVRTATSNSLAGLEQSPALNLKHPLRV